jgi:hypothetical protein
MTRLRFASAVILALGALACGSASAHGVRFGFAFGFPIYPPAWYYPPSAYYDPSPMIAAPASPPVYIERGDAQAAPPLPEQYWYYCPDSKMYYPYVKDCRSTWQRVPTRPPAS